MTPALLTRDDQRTPAAYLIFYDDFARILKTHFERCNQCWPDFLVVFIGMHNRHAFVCRCS